MWALKDQLNKGTSSQKLCTRISIARLIQVLLNQYTDYGQGTSKENFWGWFKENKDRFPFDTKTARETFQFYQFLATYPLFLKHRKLLFSYWSRVRIKLMKWFNSDESQALPSTSSNLLEKHNRATQE
jgi:hypothetical protein